MSRIDSKNRKLELGRLGLKEVSRRDETSEMIEEREEKNLETNLDVGFLDLKLRQRVLCTSHTTGAEGHMYIGREGEGTEKKKRQDCPIDMRKLKPRRV